MEETGAETKEKETGIPYKVPEQIPRNTLYFRIAQLEQLSRIKDGCIIAIEEGEKPSEIKAQAVLHTQEAEFSDEIVSGITRVFDCVDKFQENLRGVFSRAKEEFLSRNPEVEITDWSSHAESNRFIARYIYHDIFKKDPVGDLRVFYNNLGICIFLSDNREDFAKKSNLQGGVGGAKAGLLAERRSLNEETGENSILSRFKVVVVFTPTIPEDMDEVKKCSDADEILAHEFNHAVGAVIEDEFSPDGYVNRKGQGRQKDKYKEMVWQNWQTEPETSIIFTQYESAVLGDSISGGYEGAKNELLAHLAGNNDYLESIGRTGRVVADKLASQLMQNYDFLKLAPENRYYKQAFEELGAYLVKAIKAFDHVNHDVYRDFAITEGIFDMFDITRWPALARAIEKKVKKYGLPSFL